MSVEDQTTEIQKIAGAINEIGKNLETNYYTKHEGRKLADAVDAYSKAMDKQRLVEKAHPLFGDHATARDFIDVMKGALATCEVPQWRSVTQDKSSEWYVNKDLNSYTSGSGPDFIPTALSNTLSMLLSQYGVARREGTVYSGVQGPLVLTRRNGTSTAVYTAASGANKDDVAVTPSVFGEDKITLTPQQIAVLSLVSDKLLYSSAINIAEIVATDVVEQAGILEDNTVIKGDASSTYGGCTGINVDANVPETAVVGSALSLDDVLGLPAKVHESVYGSKSAAYYMTGAFLSTVLRQKKASSSGVYFIDPTTGEFNIGGYPLKIWHRMDSAVTNGKYPVYFGDMKKALAIATGREMRLEVSRDYKFNTVQVAWRLIEDFSAGLVQPTAIARLKTTS